jgi:GNAT superfamily N-acetyltransferase
MGQIVLERCADAGTIAGIHAATVAVAYRPFFPEDSPPPTAEELTGEWATRLADPTAVALLATVDGRPAGAVLTRADRHHPGGEMAGLHVLPQEWGQGVGGTLHDAALSLLGGAGYDTAWLWVLVANDRARRMYEHRDWVPHTDTVHNYLGIPELRYSMPLP